jgi:hypothetical protein
MERKTSGPGAGEAIHAGHGVTDIIDMPPITAQQVEQATSSAQAAAKKAQDMLAPYVKPEVKRRTLRKPNPGTDAFVLAMANLQKRYRTQLGHLNTDPATMQQRGAVAAAANEAAATLFVLAGQLIDIANANLGEAKKDGRAIYRRGLEVRAAYPEIGEAIAPFAEANSRNAKKSAQARKVNEAAEKKARQATAAAPAAVGSSTTTTVTTSQK